MEGSYARVASESEMKKRGIGESRKDLWISPHGRPIDGVGDPHDPESAPGHQDAPDVGISKHSIQIVGAGAVGPGQVSPAIIEVARQPDAKTCALEHPRARLRLTSLYGAGRRHDPDRIPRTQPRGRDQRGIPIGCGEGGAAPGE
jgi:hypothetical protein